MKFLCSVLILAGVFTLNDAFTSIGDEMRRINAQFVRQMIANNDRGAKPECSSALLKEISVCLDTLNAALQGCDNAKQAAMDKLEKEAAAQNEDFKSRMAETCQGDCSALPTALEALACVQNATSTNSKLLSTLSVEAASYKTKLNKNLENTNGIEAVCNQDANANYATESTAANTKFQNCLDGK